MKTIMVTRPRILDIIRAAGFWNIIDAHQRMAADNVLHVTVHVKPVIFGWYPWKKRLVHFCETVANWYLPVKPTDQLVHVDVVNTP